MYSNISDENSQKMIQKLLLEAGISQSNVDSFLKNVQFFNNSIENTSLIGDFTVIDSLNPEYNFEKITELWDTKNPDFIGFNCRITSFGFFSDLITSTGTNSLNTDNLMFDLNSLENLPSHITISPDQEVIFKNFYAQIATPRTKDLAVHIKSVQDAWKDRGIDFIFKNDKTKASIISLFLHSNEENEESYLFVGHTGIAIPLANNEILFIEKLAFQEPYQAIKFADRNALIGYLMTKYDTDYNQANARPFVMENGELIKGFENFIK